MSVRELDDFNEVKKHLELFYKTVDDVLKIRQSYNPQDSFNTKQLKENFASDLMILTAYAACADRTISYEELERINRLLDLYDLALAPSKCKELSDFVSQTPFTITKAFSALVLTTKKTLDEGMKLGDSSVIASAFLAQNAVKALPYLLIAHAAVMCYIATAGGMSIVEKNRIIECIEKYADYAGDVYELSATSVKELKTISLCYIDEKFAAHSVAPSRSVSGAGSFAQSSSSAYAPEPGQYNFTPQRTPYAGKILHVEVKKGDLVAKNDLVAIILSNGNPYKILANVPGRIDKILHGVGDTVKAEDTIASIAKIQ